MASTLEEFELKLQELYAEVGKSGNKGVTVSGLLKQRWKHIAAVNISNVMKAWFNDENDNFVAYCKSKKVKRSNAYTLKFIEELYNKKGWKESEERREAVARIPAGVDMTEDNDDDDEAGTEANDPVGVKTTGDDDDGVVGMNSRKRGREKVVHDDETEQLLFGAAETAVREAAAEEMDESGAEEDESGILDVFEKRGDAVGHDNGEGVGSLSVFDLKFGTIFLRGGRHVMKPWQLDTYNLCEFPYGNKHSRGTTIYNAELGIPEFNWFESVCGERLLDVLNVDSYFTELTGQAPVYVI